MLVWLGSFLLFFGFVIRFTIPHKRIWARIVARPKGAVVGVASLGSKEAALGTEFEGLVNDIRAALAAPATELREYTSWQRCPNTPSSRRC